MTSPSLKKKRKREMGGTPLIRFCRKVLFTREDAAAPRKPVMCAGGAAESWHPGELLRRQAPQGPTTAETHSEGALWRAFNY
ncbi:Hypothetical predicted protein [Scomber scombrus]|uniref:Uncharacterized protein n=1 Tax=Scomber scombrus TaxID=13677 RepID=A0AAV1MVK6_SCOSC